MKKLDRVLLTFEEVAEMLSISKRSVSRAVQQKELKVVQAPGTFSSQGKRIPLQEVEDWLRRQLPSASDSRPRGQQSPQDESHSA